MTQPTHIVISTGIFLNKVKKYEVERSQTLSTS